VYKSSGSFDSILIGDQLNVDEIRKFSYNQDTVKVNKFSQGALFEESHVSLGDVGKIQSIRDISPGADNWEQESFAYRSDIPALVDKSVRTMYGTNSAYESFYQWEVSPAGIGFNMTKHVTNSGVYTYVYYFDKPSQAGDYLNFEKIIATYDKWHKPFSSANLLKSIKLDGNPLVDVTYTFDSEDRITSFSVSYDGNPDVEKWDITYECN
jgi:hypothetical protein